MSNQTINNQLGDTLSHPYIIDSYEDLTHHGRLLRLVPYGQTQMIDYRCGQYARLDFSGAGFAPNTAQHIYDMTPGANFIRPFSIASHPGADTLDFYISTARLPNEITGPHLTQNLTQNLTMREVIRTHLSAGHIIGVQGPYGHLPDIAALKTPVLAVAGGTGIAPLLSMIQAGLEGGFAANITLYYGVRSDRDMYREDLLCALQGRYSNFEYQIFLSDPINDNSYANNAAKRQWMVGWPHEAIDKDFQDLKDFSAILSGPPAMAQALRPILASKNLPDASIYCD